MRDIFCGMKFRSNFFQWKIARYALLSLSLSLSLLSRAVVALKRLPFLRDFVVLFCRVGGEEEEGFFAFFLSTKKAALAASSKGPHHRRVIRVWSRGREEDALSIWTLGPPPIGRRRLWEEEEEEKEKEKKTRVRRLVPEEEMPSDTKEDIIIIIIINIIIINERTRSRALGSPMRSRSSRSTRIR